VKSLQHFWKDPRPYPECSQLFFSDYGLPAEEITTVVSIVTCIIFYWLIFKLYRRTMKQKNCLPKYLRILNRLANVVVAIFMIIVYPIVLYNFGIVTVLQAVVSVIFAFFTSVLACVMVLFLTDQLNLSMNNKINL